MPIGGGTIGGVAPDIVQRYILNADQYKAEIKDVAKEVRKQERSERDLKKVMDAVTKSEQKTTKQTGALTSATRKNTAVTNRNTTAKKKQAAASQRMAKMSTMAKGALVGLAAGGVALLTRELVKNLRESDKFAQASKIYTGDIKAARTATQGLAKDIDIMVAKNRLMTLGVKMTDAEFNKMLGNLTKISGAMAIDMKFALESATTMLARQSTAVADNVGVVIKAEEAYEKYAASIGKSTNELTASEKKIAFQQEALTQLSSKAGELADRTKTASSEMTKLGNTISTAATKAFSSLNKWKPFVRLIGDLGVAANQAMRDLGMITSGKVKTPELRAQLGRQLNESRRQLKLAGVDPDKPTLPTGIPTATQQALKRQIAQMRLTQARLDRLSELGSLERRRKGLGKLGEKPIKRAAPLRRVQERIVTPAKGRSRRSRRSRRKRKTGLDLLPDEFSPAGLPTFEDIFGKKEAAPVSAMNKMAKATEATSAAMSESQVIVGQLTQGFVNMGLSALQAGSNMSNAGNKASEALTSVLSMAGGAIGTAVGGPVGGAVGGTLGSALGGIFGSLFGSGRDLNRRKSSTVKRTTTAYQPGFGRAVESQRAIVLNVFVNDPANPSSQVITDAQLQRAANAA